MDAYVDAQGQVQTSMCGWGTAVDGWMFKARCECRWVDVEGKVSLPGRKA